MAVKNTLFVALCILTVNYSNANLEVVNGRLKLSIVTTSGCGDTVNFINDQLLETYEAYGRFLDVEFIPWGRTQRGVNGLICQFGEQDCWANRLHRCVLNILGDWQAAQVHYMSCEFFTPYPSFLQGSYECARVVGLSLSEVDNCVNAPSDIIDTMAEQAAALPMQVINFVPAIVFNDQPNLELHNGARSQLKYMVCLALAQNPTTGVTNC